jgi:REP element-mobilizing transposase RayT
MLRAMRVEFPGAIYHVMDRGDRREDIFVNDVDRQDFLKTLADACQKTAWQIHGTTQAAAPGLVPGERAVPARDA